MSIYFRIFPNHGLVYVRFEGVTRMDDGMESFKSYREHPDFRPGQKQLLDLSAITGMDKDYVKLFALQAEIAEVMVTEPAQTLIVYYAPTPISYDNAKLISRSWDSVCSVVTSVQRSEADCLNILGLSEPNFAALLQAA